MAEGIYATPNMMTKARNTQGEREERIVEIYAMSSDYVGTEESSNTLGTVTREWGSWNKSRKLCVTDGADLVVVDSKEERDFISRYGGTILLGATDEASDGLWRWLDGTVLSVDNPSWRKRET
ncbi:unnamed protein product [Boreogadus saida]